MKKKREKLFPGEAAELLVRCLSCRRISPLEIFPHLEDIVNGKWKIRPAWKCANKKCGKVGYLPQGFWPQSAKEIGTLEQLRSQK